MELLHLEKTVHKVVCLFLSDLACLNNHYVAGMLFRLHLFFRKTCRDSGVFCAVKSLVSQQRAPFLPSLLLVFALGVSNEGFE